MRRCRTVPGLAALLLLVLGGTPAGAQTPRDGEILQREPFEYPPYAALPAWMHDDYDAARYDEYTRSGPAVWRVKYGSDGLGISAFLVVPDSPAGTRLPIIVYNRGGVGENARIGAATFHVIDELRRLAAGGFVVVASQYRGVDGAGGRDELGGADLRDVMHLVPLIRSLDGVDPSRVFMVGHSRGAQMTLQAIRDGFSMRAAVTVGAPTDWEEARKRNPGLDRVAADHWPAFATRPADEARERSAARWPERITVPLLIIHGGGDTIIPVSQALGLAQRLTDAGRPYQLLVYAEDDHGVNGNRADRIRRTLEWFRAHDAAPGQTAAAAMVPVVASDYRFEMPDRIAAGLATFRFENRGAEPHYLRFVRVEAGRTPEDVLAWRRSRGPMPPWMTAAGGAGTIGPGRMIEYTARFEPGHYIALCGHPSADGSPPHAERGMIRAVEVVDAGTGAPVPAPGDARLLELRDFAIAGALPTAAGPETWHVANRGAVTHQLLIVRVRPPDGAEAELSWFRGGSRGPRPGEPVGGVIELAPDRDAWIRVALDPGDYLLLCGVAAGERRHFDHGMTARFTISARR